MKQKDYLGCSIDLGTGSQLHHSCQRRSQLFDYTHPLSIRRNLGGCTRQPCPHQAQNYVLRATAGQLMQVSLRANNTAQLAIWSANGTALLADNTAQGWQGKLPNSGDNRIRVTSLDQNSSFACEQQFSPASNSPQEGPLPKFPAQCSVVKIRIPKRWEAMFCGRKPGKRWTW